MSQIFSSMQLCRLTPSAKNLLRLIIFKADGSSFPHPTGDPNKINEQGQRVLNEIISDPQMVQRPNRFGGVDYIAPDGRGARFNPDGSMRGFLEP